MTELFVFRTLARKRWWSSLAALERALEGNRQRSGGPPARRSDKVARRYAELVASLVAEGYPSLEQAAALALIEGERVLAGGLHELPSGLRAAALLDIELIQEKLEQEWQERAEARCGSEMPPLRCLAADSALEEASALSAAEIGAWAERLKSEEPEELLEALLEGYAERGTGVFTSYIAFRWRNGGLEGIARPASDRLDDLVGLESQLGRLTTNLERFLDSRPALHTLLYGPRGSGKSTAVRGLLNRYAERGMRLVEIAPESLDDLPQLSELLRREPYRFVLYVDDLSFESGDAGYQPLKTLLEGSLVERPHNVLLVATSNRRHLVRESFSDRPMPESDDVHGWDTTNERLALADRFGLAITFPAADQRKYLTMVRELAGKKGVTTPYAELDEAAIRFAEWGNGYSGRTARQFVDTLE